MQVVVIDPREQLAEGVAYSTQDERHRLNVRAKQMSVLVGEPDHFVNWSKMDREGFAPRIVFSHYVRHVLNDAITHAAVGSSMVHLRSSVVAVTPHTKFVEVECDDATIMRADFVVLATGNAAPAHHAFIKPTIAAHSRCVMNPWERGQLQRIDSGTVLTIGTGLTCVDVAVSVLHAGAARVIGVSRHGLLPTAHTHVDHPPPLPELHTPREVLHWLRHNRHAWREAMNGLRTITQRLWSEFSDFERRQFLRHARRYWEVHRHRIAADIASEISQFLGSGQLSIQKSAVRAISMIDESTLSIELSNGKTIVADWLVLCTGPSDADALTAQPLQRLIRQGHAVVGPYGMGVYCDPESGALMNSRGEISTQIFVLGGLRKGMLWETIAIPEIHVQADQLGRMLSSDKMSASSSSA